MVSINLNTDWAHKTYQFSHAPFSASTEAKIDRVIDTIWKLAEQGDVEKMEQVANKAVGDYLNNSEAADMIAHAHDSLLSALFSGTFSVEKPTNEKPVIGSWMLGNEPILKTKDGDDDLVEYTVSELLNHHGLMWCSMSTASIEDLRRFIKDCGFQSYWELSDAQFKKLKREQLMSSFNFLVYCEVRDWGRQRKQLAVK